MNLGILMDRIAIRIDAGVDRAAAFSTVRARGLGVDPDDRLLAVCTAADVRGMSDLGRVECAVAVDTSELKIIATNNERIILRGLVSRPCSTEMTNFRA